MLSRVAHVRTDVSEECSATIIGETRISELGTKLGTTLAVTGVLYSSPILVALIMEELSSSGTSVLTRATLRNIPEDGIIHSYSHENFKFYKEVK
jgi:hypothetical protein